MKFVTSRLEDRSLAAHGLLTALAFVGLSASAAIVNATYAASNHPVGNAEGQTTFDAERIKQFYAVMEDAGTLGTYVQSQLLDFGLIAMLMVFGICLGSFLARINAHGSSGAKAGRVVAWSCVLGELSDVGENLVSFMLLSDPVGFANWLAIPYSTFAVIKFAFLTLAIISAVISAAGWTVGRLRGRSTAPG